ncbi:MAG: RNA polymerase sporulation sigma factor SigE [Clostridia bacterium]|nr:RNA polymerase sporulation sigma factor SigE [Clostridia bacterium]
MEKAMKKYITKMTDALTRLFSKIFGTPPVYYVNGRDTLPPPLDTHEENLVISRLESDPEGARQTLIEHNLRLVVFIAKKFESTGIGLEDLISIGTIGLIKAINTFKADKNIKLATYASRCIENEILMFIRKSSQSKSELSIDEPLSVDWDGNELLLSDILCSENDSVFCDIEQKEEREIIKSALCSLSEREKVIISLRFGLDGARERTQKELADMLGISQSYISRLEKRIIADLREKLDTKY